MRVIRRGTLVVGVWLVAAACSKKNEVNATNDVCEQDFQDCNRDPADGCESNTTLDVLNCGACGVACSDAHGEPTCQASRCAIQCAAGWDDCNRDVSDGCEVETGADVGNCGACGAACSGQHATLSCVSGQCTVSQCLDGRTDCNQDGDDGCERDLTTDADHCGACNNACDAPGTDGTCTASQCSTACVSGFHDCSGTCLSDTSPQSCGTSCTPCTAPTGATPTCDAGVCGVRCPGSQTYCAGVDTCFDLQGDGTNCGSCGHDCGGATCTAGKCDPLAIVSGLGEPRVVALSDDELFVANAANLVYRAPKAGGTPTLLHTASSAVKDLAVWDGHLLLSNGTVINLTSGAPVQSRTDLTAWSLFQGHVLAQGTELDPEYPATSRFAHMDPLGVAPRLVTSPTVGPGGLAVTPLAAPAFSLALGSAGVPAFFRWQSGGVLPGYDGQFTHNNDATSWYRIPVGGSTTTTMGPGAPLSMLFLGGENFAVIEAPSSTTTSVVTWTSGDTSVTTLTSGGRATSLTADDAFLYLAQSSDGTVLRLARPAPSACAAGATRCSPDGVPQSCQAGAWVDGTACSAGSLCSAGACLDCAQARWGTTTCGNRCVDTDRDVAHCGACGAVCAGRCVFGRCVEDLTLMALPTDTSNGNNLIGSVGGALFTLHTTVNSFTNTRGGVVTTYAPDGTNLSRGNANIAFTTPGANGGSHPDVRAQSVGNTVYSRGFPACTGCTALTYALYTATWPDLLTWTELPSTTGVTHYVADADGVVVRRLTTASPAPAELRSIPVSGPSVVLVPTLLWVGDYEHGAIAADASFVYYAETPSSGASVRAYRVARGGGTPQLIPGSTDVWHLAVVGTDLFGATRVSGGAGQILRWSTLDLSLPPVPVVQSAPGSIPRSNGGAVSWWGPDALGASREWLWAPASGTATLFPSVAWSGNRSVRAVLGGSSYAPTEAYFRTVARITPP